MAEPGCIEISVYSSCPVGFYRLTVFSMMHLTISLPNFFSDVTWDEKKNLQQEGEVYVQNPTRSSFSTLWPNECLGERRAEASMCERQGAPITSVWWSDKGFNEDTLTTVCAVLPVQADQCCPEGAAQFVCLNETQPVVCSAEASLAIPACLAICHHTVTGTSVWYSLKWTSSPMGEGRSCSRWYL